METISRTFNILYEFKYKYLNHDIKTSIAGDRYIEIYDVHFIADNSEIAPGVEHEGDNTQYNESWYKKWYDPIVFSEQYYMTSQFDKCFDALMIDRNTRHAYISMMDWHNVHNEADIMICTIGMQWIVNDKNQLDYYVYMRANDVIEYRNDYHWQRSLYDKMLKRLIDNGVSIDEGNIYWNATSMQLQEKYFEHFKG